MSPSSQLPQLKNKAFEKGICIQGYEGSFHQVAANHFFGKGVPVLPCDTFRQLVRLSSDPGESAGGVMAIENSIAGSILPNYSLLQKSKLVVVGELYLSISQNLLANKDVEISQIREVHSHPMAILQCLDYLEQHEWKLIETEDTALSARHISQHRHRHTAAIGSKLAAELYNLRILTPDIHTMKNNVTRFLILVNRQLAEPVTDANKASVYFQTDHSQGALARVLTSIAAGGVNLSKLQSMPIQGSNFKYGFYADLEFESRQRLDRVLKEMTALTNSLKIFGIYKKGKQIKA
jgi:prephenate dehydratase